MGWRTIRKIVWRWLSISTGPSFGTCLRQVCVCGCSPTFLLYVQGLDTLNYPDDLDDLDDPSEFGIVSSDKYSISFQLYLQLQLQLWLVAPIFAPPFTFDHQAF